ncbi:MAG: glycosyl hydrolase family 32 [Candidatus Nephthysia bennettiae]|nr:MAG: glycosyl hydrolase family 32 [Candidatus Dormibacteraeota bacterium]
MNDPCGLMHRAGEYHVFYQYNPRAARWGDIQWGHAVSSNLVDWTHLPVALAPTPGGADSGGCWTGCGVDDHGLPTLVYTGVRDLGSDQVATVCLAHSEDGLLTWQKAADNPVIDGPPGDLVTLGFRDPFVWHDGARWQLLMGAGLEGVGGAVLRYTSTDLHRWQYAGPLYERPAEADGPLSTGYMWECPQLVKVGDRDVLIVSVHGREKGETQYSVYFVGHCTKGRFIPDGLYRMDHGPDYYAASAMSEGAGRSVVWAWSWEARTVEAQLRAGWAGTLALPRAVDLNRDGRLIFSPVPELASLRQGHVQLVDLAVPRETTPLAEFSGRAIELDILVDVAGEECFDLDVLRSPNGAEFTRIRYDVSSGLLAIDRRMSSTDSATVKDMHVAPLLLDDSGRIPLRIFVDRSIVEVFSGDVSLTARVYPAGEESSGVAIGSRLGRARILRLDGWTMRPVWT